jgi:hypothetical protein
MKKTSNVIHVPKPRNNAFNKHRPISTLLRMQVQHFHEIERQLLLAELTDIELIKTEGQAAEYVDKMTAKLRGAPTSKPERKDVK